MRTDHMQKYGFDMRLGITKYDLTKVREAGAMIQAGAPWQAGLAHVGCRSRSHLLMLFHRNSVPYHRSGLRRVRSMRMMLPNKDTERAYLAGIIDGEGHIAARVRRDGRQLTFQIVVANTSYELMDWLAPLGGTVRLAGLAGSNKRTKTMWKWVVTGILNVQAVLACVRPHLVIKSAHADRVLNLIAERIAAAELAPPNDGG
jgi:hypothetical protein